MGGHAQQVSAADGDPFGEIVYDGKTYEFLQFHFHEPSEHTISGLRFDMEMHMVHQNKDKSADFLVLGYLFNLGGADNEWLNEAGWKTASPTTDVSVKLAGSIDPWNMAKRMNGMEAFLYKGSFTTPPCTEGVHWFVWREWNYLSRVQWDQYKASLPHVAMVYTTGNGSYRPTQALNGRVITLRTIHLDNGDYLSAGTIAGIVIACAIGIALLIGVPATCWWCKRKQERADDAKQIAAHIEKEAENDQAYQPVKN